MNELQIFRNTVNHIETENLLYYANFTPDIENRFRAFLGVDYSVDLREYFGMYRPLNISMTPSEEESYFDFERYYKDVKRPENSYIDHLGVLHLRGSMYHFTRYVSPLRNATDFSEITEYRYYDYSFYTDEGMRSRVEKAHVEGRVARCWIGHMYEDSWQIRGYEQFLEDMILRPEWCTFILDKIKEKNIILAKAAAKAGVDVIATGDDVATQNALIFSPKLWREIMKPRWAEVFREARKIKADIQIWYHSDGNILEIIEDLIEIGVTILNPIQPECLDPIEVKSKYGNRLTLDGTIGTQTVMPFGTPKEVKEYVWKRREELGKSGGLILSPTHVIEPDVPIENILAFLEACK